MDHLTDGSLLSAYADDAIDEEDRRRLDSHLDDCSSCRAALAGLRRLKSAVAAAPRHALPAALRAPWEQRARREARRAAFRAFWQGPRLWWPAGLVAAAAVALAFLVPRADKAAIPLAPLMEAHARYASESFVPSSDLYNSDFSAQLASYHED